MYYAVLAFVFAIMSAIKCVPLANLKTSDNLQNSSTILETFNTFDALNAIRHMCRKNQSQKGSYELYCRQLIKENGTYLRLEFIIKTKINEIRSSLVKLLHLENKAIACRGMRHLLPIIMYGIFINNTINGSTGNGNSYGMDTFDDLLKKKSDFLNDENSSIEKKLQQIKTSTIENGITNEKIDERPAEQIKGEFEEISTSFMGNITTTILLILPFIENLDCFHNLYKINKVTTADKSERDSLLLLIFDEVKRMYKTECSADIDATALLQNRDGRWKFERNHDSIPLLVGEIDRLSVEVQKDLQSLFMKFLSATNPKRPLQQCPDVSIVFYHTFNKYYDPEVWRLIGNEAIVDHSSDSGKPEATTIDEIASNLLKNIQDFNDGLTVEITKKVKCRCYAYLKLLMKLYYCSMRVLAVNAREVQRLAQEMDQIEQGNVYSSLHDEIKGLWTAECLIGDDDVGAIDALLDRDGGDKYFRSVYAFYWNRNARSVSRAIDTISNYSIHLGFVADLGPMLQEIDRIQVQSATEMKSVESLVDRYKWGERAYKDHCISFSGAEYDMFSKNMKRASQVTTRLTLEWIMTMTDILNNDLGNDLYKFNWFP